jgi:glycosyltransferase involved in cell wall biosynthesis
MVRMNAAETYTFKEADVFSHFKMPSASLKVCIVLPAKNEADTILHTLKALSNQVNFNGSKLDYSIYEVVLLVNNCTDNTYNIAANFAMQNPAFNLHIAEVKLPACNANIGYVRRILMDEACSRLSGSRQGIIASTDSDTIADKFWLSYIIDEITNGYDAVGGRILTSKTNHQARIYYLRDISYRLLAARAASVLEGNKKNTTHYQFFGASMAITCSSYKNCGRLPDVTHLEDMALSDSLLKIDAKICYSPFVKVYTSSRTEGRVEIGFSEQLKKWALLSSKNNAQLVESVSALLIKIECKNKLRKYFELFKITRFLEQQLIDKISGDLFINYEWLIQQLNESKYFGALWQAIELEITKGQFYTKYPPIPVTSAIAALRLFLNQHQTFSKTSNL